MKQVHNIAVLVPVFNEEATLQLLFARLSALESKASVRLSFIIIDDGSRDQSAAIIRKEVTGRSNWSALFLSRNFGHPMALSAGLSAVSKERDAVFILDADLQDPPELLDEFISKMNEGYDVVYGIRRNRKEGFLKKLTYSLYYRMQAGFSNVSMPLDAGDFSLISMRVVKQLQSMPEESRYILGLRSWVGFNQTGIEYDRA